MPKPDGSVLFSSFFLHLGLGSDSHPKKKKKTYIHVKVHMSPQLSQVNELVLSLLELYNDKEYLEFQQR